MSKKVIIIEQSFGCGNPGLKSLVAALPYLLESGLSIEVWTEAIDEELLPLVTWRRLRYLQLPGSFGAMSFWLSAQIIASWRRNRIKQENVIYLTTGGKYWFADLSMFQFYNPTWWQIQGGKIYRGNESRLRRILTLWGIFEDLGVVRLPYCKRILAASRAIQADIERDKKRSNLTVSVLPNAVDTSTFAAPSKDSRLERRRQLGFGDSHTVLLFVSMGHYVRKGFWRALACLENLRKQGHRDFRFLMVGGYPRKLKVIKGWLDRHHSGWQEWIVFTGMTDDVPTMMAAADALFFPSYFEAFSLVEIEAAALGLPLLLTRHHGSEMILREDRNGIFLPDDISGMGEALLKFRKQGLIDPCRDLGEALAPEEWAYQFENEMHLIFDFKTCLNL